MVAVERAMREVEMLRVPDAVLLAAAHADRQERLSAEEEAHAVDWLSVSTLGSTHGVTSDAPVQGPCPALPLLQWYHVACQESYVLINPRYCCLRRACSHVPLHAVMCGPTRGKQLCRRCVRARMMRREHPSPWDSGKRRSSLSAWLGLRICGSASTPQELHRMCRETARSGGPRSLPGACLTAVCHNTRLLDVPALFHPTT